MTETEGASAEPIGDARALPAAQRADAWPARLARGRLPWALAAGALALLAGSFLLDPLVFHLDWNDAWVHVAVLRQWAGGDLLSPGNPHYDSPAPSREYTPWFLLLALVMRATGLSPFGALQLGACLGTALLWGGLGLFLATWFRHRAAAPLGFVAAFFFWADIWEFVGFFNYRSQLFNNYFPAAAALGMALLAWTLVLRALRAPGRAPTGTLAGLAALIAVLMVCHQLTGGFALGGAALLGLLEPGATARRRALVAATVALGAAASALWPLYDPWAVVATAARNDPDWRPPSKFDRLPAVLGFALPQLLGLAGLLHPRLRRALLPFALGFAGCFAAFLAGNLTGRTFSHRFLPFACLFLSIGLVALWLAALPVAARGGDRLTGTGRRLARLTLAGLAPPLIALQLAVATRDVGRAALGRAEPVRAMFEGLAVAIPPDGVTLATPGVALSLSAVGRKVVAIPRGLYLVPDEDARRRDAARFFGAAGEAERRAILARWQVRQIVFRSTHFVGPWWHDDLPPETQRALRALGPIQVVAPDFVIVRVGA